MRAMRKKHAIQTKRPRSLRRVGCLLALLGMLASSFVFPASANDQIKDQCGPRGAGSKSAKEVFFDEFDGPLDLTTNKHVGIWRANDFWQNPVKGYRDFGGASWNVNPLETPKFSPFSVRNGVLAISARRMPSELAHQIKVVDPRAPVPAWAGGTLITDKRRNSFLYGYFEFRVRWPDHGRGMFPAIWLYVADGRRLTDKSKSGAEIDIAEIMGYGKGLPWTSTLHRRDYLGHGIQSTMGIFYSDTANWHIIGLDWQPDHICLYSDGHMISEVSGPTAAWFDVPMSIHLNYAVDGKFLSSMGRTSDATTPSPLEMQVDYVRVYSKRPARDHGGP